MSPNQARILCSFIGKGDAQNVSWRYTECFCEVAVAGGERSGFARAGSRYNSDMTFSESGGECLFVIKTG